MITLIILQIVYSILKRISIFILVYTIQKILKSVYLYRNIYIIRLSSLLLSSPLQVIEIEEILKTTVQLKELYQCVIGCMHDILYINDFGTENSFEYYSHFQNLINVISATINNALRVSIGIYPSILLDCLWSLLFRRVFYLNLFLESFLV